MDKNVILITLSESDRTQFGRIPFSDQTEAQKIFSAIWELESQVNNGGFDQYFRNSETDLIAYAPIALHAIAAHSCAAIVEDAIRLIEPIPATQNERYDALDALDERNVERLEELNAEFIAYPDNLTELLFDHVCQHPDEFGSITEL